MQIAAVDSEQRLYLSSAIDDWQLIEHLQIRVIVDLDADVDAGVPTIADSILYVYYPIRDHELPHVETLEALSVMSAQLYRSGQRLLVHCGMGLNRSALVAGRILYELGWSGPDAVSRLRECRPGALFNECFCEYLMTLPPRLPAR